MLITNYGLARYVPALKGESSGSTQKPVSCDINSAGPANLKSPASWTR
jgi:hypothetical protein